MKRPARVPTRLSESLHRQINAYALAASAAGVSVLALAQPAEARIVYTKIHRVISFDNPYKLDLNHDGVVDFNIGSATCNTHSCWFSLGLGIYGYIAGKRIWNEVGFTTRTGNGLTIAAALKSGAKIPGEGVKYSKEPEFPVLVAHGTKQYYGNWFNVEDRYLGLLFYVNGKRHYGWARLNVQTTKHPFTIHGTLTGYAYETIPNKPIIAGKTHGKNEATLGRLAQGASGVVQEKK